MSKITPHDLELLLTELLEGAPTEDLRDLRRALTVLPADEVKASVLEVARAVRERQIRAEAEALHPLGSTVATIVCAIGGRSERVTGEVVDYRRSSVVVKTECHGRIVVPADKIEARESA